jgi:hypothetical protein
LRQPSNGINSVAEVDEEKAALRRQLRKSANQIVELEMKLQEDGEEKVEVVESKLEGSKDALAFVETERELALREVKVLLKHHYALDNSYDLGLMTLILDRLEMGCKRIVMRFSMTLRIHWRNSRIKCAIKLKNTLQSVLNSSRKLAIFAH